MAKQQVNMDVYGDVPLNRVVPGVIVYAHIPFEDDPRQSKMRPAVVIDRMGRTIRVLPIYSAHRLGRLPLMRRNRRSYIDMKAVDIDRYDLVNLDPQEVDDETWAKIEEMAILPDVAE